MTTLVLLPGLNGTATLFEPLCRQLDPAIVIQCIAYPSKRFLTYAELTAFVRARLPQGPLLLLGESFSGPVALMAAAAEGVRIKGVILSTTFIRSPNPLLTRLQFLLPLMPLNMMVSWMTARFLLGSDRTPQLAALLEQALADVPVAVLKRRLSEVGRVDVSGALRRLCCPLLYLQTTRDRLVPAAAAAVVREVFPETALCRLAGPHCLLQAAAEPAARQIEAFWRSVFKQA